MPASLPLCNLASTPTATPAAIKSAPGRLMAVAIVGGSAASSVEFKNATTDTGTVLFSMNALTNDFQFVDLSKLGGIEFNTGIYVKPAGTGATVYSWYW